MVRVGLDHDHHIKILDRLFDLLALAGERVDQPWIPIAGLNCGFQNLAVLTIADCDADFLSFQIDLQLLGVLSSLLHAAKDLLA